MKLSELSGEDILDIEKVEHRRGFKIILDLIDPEEDDKYRYETYLSVHVDDTPWSREELTNDKVYEALDNLMEEVKEDRPELEFDEATIDERTEIRKIKKV